MRIALFHNVPSGGAKRAIHEWTRRLAGRHEIRVYTLSTADAGFCDIRPFVSAHEEFHFAPSRPFESPFGRLNQLLRWTDLTRLLALGRKIAARIDRAGVDVVFANTCQFTFVPTLLLYVSRPAVYFLHEPFGRAATVPSPRSGISRTWRSRLDGADPLIRLYRGRLRRTQDAIVSGPTRFLANSAFTACRMRAAYGVSPSICPVGVDVAAFRPANGAVKGRHVLAVGELTPRKGFGFLVEALGHIPSGSRPALRLVCNSADDRERARVEELARQRLVRLEVRTHLSTPQVAHEYSEAALFVCAALEEPFGLAPVEAMACGTPVVAVREGGVAESVLHDRTGLLVERDAEVFGAAVQRLLANPARCREYGENARAHVEANWGWDKSVAALEAHLREAVRLGTA